MKTKKPENSDAESLEHPLIKFARGNKELLDAMADVNSSIRYSERKIAHIRRKILADNKLSLDQVLERITNLYPSAMDIMVLLEDGDDLKERLENDQKRRSQKATDSVNMRHKKEAQALFH